MMQQFHYTLSAGLLSTAKQILWLARLAKQVIGNWLSSLLLLITLLSSAVQSNAQTVSCTTPSFAAATNFAIGTNSNPPSVTTADFNGDGKPDLATLNSYSGNVVVLLGNGAGGFGTAANFKIGILPSSVITADFNGDGKTDIATTDFYSNNVSVLLGNGAGGFAAAANYSTGQHATSVTTGDFNGDGKADIATANGDSNNVSVLIGNGAGGFAAPIHYNRAPFSTSVTTGDFNGDGKLDIATANGDANNVSVLIGNGAGGFAAAINYSTGQHATSVTTGDFNGDGKLDLVTANLISDNVSVLIGNGTGGFAVATNFNAGTNPSSVTTGDFNGDGKVDIATANGGSNNVSVLIGNGAGGFAAATNFNVGADPHAVTIADFNRDGKLDIATVNGGSNNVSMLLNSCGNIVLPIRLVDFTAKNEGGVNKLTWNTTAEDAGDYFDVEQSTDGTTFTQIATLASRYTYGGTYQLTDSKPATGINYYRLKMKTAGGNSQYSKVVSATIAKSNFIVQAFPNPVEDVLTVRLTGTPGDNAIISIIDASGKHLQQIKMNSAVLSLSLNGLTPGLYLLKYTDGIHIQIIKITKQ